MAFSHIDNDGNARMVDVDDKPITSRKAIAKCDVILKPETVNLILDDAIAKGNVLTTAKIAGIQAAKKTAELIPMCHNIFLSDVDLSFEVGVNSISISATAIASAKTGVEMEALTAASVAALTIYDMCKAVDKLIVISNLRLIEKTGGKSGRFLRSENE